MTVLPGQKLSIGESFISIAAGLMMFLLPNDAHNQFESEIVCYGYIFVVGLLITSVLIMLIKRYEAIGTEMLATSVFILIKLVFSIVTGIISKGREYWPSLNEYNIVSIFLIWVTPFGIAIALRIVSGMKSDSNDKRRSFARFMTLSMRSLMIVYGIVLIFKLIIPTTPKLEAERSFYIIPFDFIRTIISDIGTDDIVYLLWHLIILMPLTFYLSVLIPKLKVWHSVIIAISLGLAIEALQFLFNTGTASVDDIVLYISGAVLGVVLKNIIDFLRRKMTGGSDKCMLSFEYIPLPRKPGQGAQIVEE